MEESDTFYDQFAPNLEEIGEVSRHDNPQHTYEYTPKVTNRVPSPLKDLEPITSTENPLQFSNLEHTQLQNQVDANNQDASENAHSESSSVNKSPDSSSEYEIPDPIHCGKTSRFLSSNIEHSPSQGHMIIEAYKNSGQQSGVSHIAAHGSLGSPFETPRRNPSGRRQTVATYLASQQDATRLDDGINNIHSSRHNLQQQSNKMHIFPSRPSPRQAIKNMNGQVSQVDITIEEESDDELMIIEVSAASEEAKSRWRKGKDRAFPNIDEEVLVKQEPSDITSFKQTASKEPVPKLREVYAAQKAIFKVSNSTQPPQELGPRVVGGLTLPQVPEISSRQIQRGFITTEDPQDQEVNVSFGQNPLLQEPNMDQIDAAMGGTDQFIEDDDWMHESVEEDDSEDEKFMEDVRIMQLMEKKKNIQPNERLELERLRNQIATKENMKEAAQRNSLMDEKRVKMGRATKKSAGKHFDNESDDDEDSLFVPESSKEKAPRQRITRRQESSDHGEVSTRVLMSTMMAEAVNGGLVGPDSRNQPETKGSGLTKAGKPRKRRAKGSVAKNAREVIQKQEDDRREKERSKAQKKKERESKVGPSRYRKESSVKSKGKLKGKKEKKGKGKELAVINGDSLLPRSNYNLNNQDTTQMMLDLIPFDPLQNRIDNPIFDADPEAVIVGKKNKQTQFSILFSNIPTQADIGGMGGGEKEITAHKKALREASKAFGFARVTAESGKWRIKGMKSTLYHHQLLGAQWMVQRELGASTPHGGLLADAMGLGKTVQTLACMVGNPPTDEDLKRKTKATLIVVPAAVMDQWMDEIRFHVDHAVFPKIHKYKRSHHIQQEILEDCDIVVTSYHDVMKEFPHPESKDEKQLLEQIGFARWFKEAFERLGTLHNIRWYRVILDEAQAIKNNTARTSIAVTNLRCIYKWCLTGTPLSNRLEELYPYLRFLKAEYSLDWKTFQKYFCDPENEDCCARINTLLSYTMMRRTMNTTLLNRPIITLPKPHPCVRYIEFSPQEEIIYRITENRFRCNLNKFFKKGEAARNYSTFMVQLLRLRQCTSHPFMLEGTIKEMWTLEDVAFLKRKFTTFEVNGENEQLPFYMQCKAWVEQSEAQRQIQRDQGVEEELLPFGAGNFGYKFNMDKAIDGLNEKDLMARLNCCVCQDLPSNPMETDCGHVFCEECLTTHMHEQAAMGMEETVCPNCGQIFGNTKVFDLPPGLRTDEDIGSPSSGRSKGKGKGKGKAPEENRPTAEEMTLSKGKDAMGEEPYTMNSTWITRSDTDPSFPLPPSAKTTMLKSILLQGFETAPDDKVVIYVQFRALARIVGRICNSENWPFLYLTGDSSLEHRTKVIKRFRVDPSIKILIAGLKCGGLGLNFPWANRCISLDLWWNHAVEQQAFGRIYRIGQDKETYMTRIVVKNSVDMRMLIMQLHKLKSLEKAMRDGVQEKIPSLGLNQLTQLFGFLKTTEDNQILSVEADYDECGESVSREYMNVDEE